MKRFAMGIVALSALVLGVFCTVQAQGSTPAVMPAKFSLVGAWQENDSNLIYFANSGRFYIYQLKDSVIQRETVGAYQLVNGQLTLTMPDGKKVEFSLDSSLPGMISLKSSQGVLQGALIKMVGEVRLATPQGGTVVLNN